MKFIKVTPYEYFDRTGEYKRKDDIVINIDHIIRYNSNYGMVDLTLTKGSIIIDNHDLSKIENMFHNAF